ncbi:DUF262 domain-containing HNH endonuclease family protein [Candidatus Poseidoniaceae archaeon]|nr:DUF262 domain-containing HNH endonuclease family protein [Candidatus Poseidoniaceae archaeon]
MPDGFYPNTASFGDILSWVANRPIMIPKYQREYEWDVGDLEVLLTDFLEHYDDWKEEPNPENRTSYFTGTIVVHQDPNNRFIVDGQQRITTTTVILCALRDIILAAFEVLGADELDDQALLTHPINLNATTSLNVVLRQIRSMIHEMDTADQEPHLVLKQQDSPRLDWIRLEWGEEDKVSALCPVTFEWRVGQGGSGLPAQGTANKPKDIYAVYLAVWEKFGLYQEGGDDDYTEFGVLHNSMVPAPVEEQPADEVELVNEVAPPFGDNEQDPQKAWRQRPVEDMTPTFQRIADLTYTIKQIAKVIKLDVDNQWMAHVIFDRANTAGKKLAMIDVVRAKAFAKLAEYEGTEDDENDLHELMETIYVSKPTKTVINEFVKHFATMRSGDLNVGNANPDDDGKCSKITGAGTRTYYQGAFNQLNSKEELVQYATDFVTAFTKYHSVLANPDLTENPKTWTKAYSRAFNFTGFKQHRPIMLKALTCENVDEEHQRKLQRCVEGIYVIHNLLMGGSPSEIETMMAEKISEISDNDSIDTVIEQLVTSFKEKSTFKQKIGVPMTQAHFENRFKERAIRNGQAHFLLRNKLRSDMVNNLADEPPNIVDAKFGNVEHILPEKPSQWGDTWYDDGQPTELHGKYVYRVGNLTLLNRSDNISISNKPFDDKKPVYLDENNPSMTQDIGDNADWSNVEIDERSDELITYIVEQWWNIFD